MVVRFRKQAIKFLQKSNPKLVAEIQEQLNQIDASIELQSIIPFTELDITKMKGDWAGYFRLRIGDIRVIFTVDDESGNVDVYKIGNRGDVYK
ncbi:type II toxin-antitoxin system RelE/ParE family toxin [Alkalinema sp. FACHB-956]|uniref:type II toxin-antitoxin system RelE/ParE family toxin n=1 Tax=Alkalinema sp. FACHB-956 TaxID=2692768 RepID=UPI001681F340|nr:type II toxin-antitoxin system RelE/ParE family toxin [Alkalinema sp. FACHB-956]